MKYVLGLLFAALLAGAAYVFVLSNADFSMPAPSVPIAMNMSLRSPEFAALEPIPEKYTCDGRGVNPPLVLGGIPEGTVTVALVMHDPDVPKALKPDGVFDHWVVYSIPVTPGQKEIDIKEDSTPGALGVSGTGKEEYVGPCPPPEYEPSQHRYVFTAYALSTELSFLLPPKKEDLMSAMNGFVLGTAELIGTYDRAEK